MNRLTYPENNLKYVDNMRHMYTFVLSCPCMSMFVFGFYVVLVSSYRLCCLSFMLRVYMAGAVWTLLSDLCLPILVNGLLCCPCLILLFQDIACGMNVFIVTNSLIVHSFFNTRMLIWTILEQDSHAK